MVSAVVPGNIGRRPDATRWSVLEVVCHLADAELLASVRIRRTITQDRPKFWGYKQEQWTELLESRRRRIETVSARFAMLRRENAELLADLADEGWSQSGTHDEYGTLSLRQLIEDYIAHTANHLDQIKRIAAELDSQNND